MNQKIYQENYASLMLQAEQAGNRKEAISLINRATQLREHQQHQQSSSLQVR